MVTHRDTQQIISTSVRWNQESKFSEKYVLLDTWPYAYAYFRASFRPSTWSTVGHFLVLPVVYLASSFVLPRVLPVPSETADVPALVASALEDDAPQVLSGAGIASESTLPTAEDAHVLAAQPRRLTARAHVGEAPEEDGALPATCMALAAALLVLLA